MKILLIHNFYEYPGGEDTYFYSLCGLLKKRGHSVAIFTKTNSSITIPTGYFKTVISLFWNPSVEKELSKAINKTKPDIVHFNNIFPLIGPGTYKICKRSGARVVQTIHNYRLFCPGGTLYCDGKLCPHSKIGFSFSKLFSKCYHNSRLATFLIFCSIRFHILIKSFNNVDVFIFPTEFTKNYYKNRFYISKKKIYVLPTFTDDMQRPEQNLRTAHPKSINNFLTQIDDSEANKMKKGKFFLFVGRFSLEKGIITLLSTISELPNINLVAIGSGPLIKTVIGYKKYKNITIKSFTQNKKELFNYMKSALFIVIPSEWYEVLPNVILESLLNKTPIIGPRIAAFKDIIVDNKTGLSFKFRDTEDLKRILTSAWVRKRGTNRMRNNVYQYYKTHFTPEIHYQKLIKIYEKNT